MNRTLMDCVRSVLYRAKLVKQFWAESLSTAVYIRNRVVNRSLPRGITPYQRWMKKSPNLSHLQVDGLNCWNVVPKHKLEKLDPRSRAVIFLGTRLKVKAIRYGTLQTQRWSYRET